jgi:hypothetical protein
MVMNLRDLILRKLRQRVDPIVLLDIWLQTKAYDVTTPQVYFDTMWYEQNKLVILVNRN